MIVSLSACYADTRIKRGFLHHKEVSASLEQASSSPLPTQPVEAALPNDQGFVVAQELNVQANPNQAYQQLVPAQYPQAYAHLQNVQLQAGPEVALGYPVEDGQNAHANVQAIQFHQPVQQLQQVQQVQHLQQLQQIQQHLEPVQALQGVQHTQALAVIPEQIKIFVKRIPVPFERRIPIDNPIYTPVEHRVPFVNPVPVIKYMEQRVPIHVDQPVHIPHPHIQTIRILPKEAFVDHRPHITTRIFIIKRAQNQFNPFRSLKSLWQ